MLSTVVSKLMIYKLINPLINEDNKLQLKISTAMIIELERITTERSKLH